MYKVGKGKKIKGIFIDEKNVKNFYEGEVLPENYIPPKDYIEQKIVEEIKEGGSNVKNRTIR
jgi:hypothetical protein